jgi:GntR family transcriptional regulator
MSNSNLSDISAGDLAHGEALPVQIARQLQDAIQAGTLPIGARLPSEPKLAELFRVSRNTAREALRLLIARGILESRKGVGTFVQSDGPRELPVETGIEELTSTTDMIRAAGRTPGSAAYRLDVVKAAADVQSALELEGDAFVYRLERVRLADERPVIHCLDYLPISRVDDAAMRGFDGTGSLFAFLRDYGLSIAVARTVIKPVLAKPAVAKALKMVRKEPVLLLLQTHFDDDDRPFLYSENTIDARFLEFQVRRVPSEPGPR